MEELTTDEILEIINRHSINVLRYIPMTEETKRTVIIEWRQRLYENSRNNKSNHIYGITKKKEGKMSYKMVTCECCGQKRREYNTREINPNTDRTERVCNRCLGAYYKRNYFDNNDWVKIINPQTRVREIPEGYAEFRDGYYSVFVAKVETLEEKGFIKCETCGTYERENKIITIEDKNYCYNCIPENYVKCSCCHKYHKREDSVYTEEHGYVCNSCLKTHFIRCSKCGSLTLNSTARNLNGMMICTRCASNIIQKYIHCYHDNNVNYNKLYTAKDNPNDIKTCYFGFELEVSGEKLKALDFMQIENIDREIVLMSDSSIKNGGFEIVTMPMTKNYIDEVFIPKFTQALKFLRDNDFKGHNYGGLHIHISQDAVTNKQISQLSEILYGNERDRRIWLGITQRKRNEMSQWSRMDNRINTFFQVNKRAESSGKANLASGRYTALCKDDRTKTYEFRIFNSNIRIERFLKNYECVLALLDYTKLNENNPLPVCNTVGFIDYVYNNQEKYKNLYEFFIERKLREHYELGYDEYEIERIA